MMRSVSPWAWVIILSATAAGLFTLVAHNAQGGWVLILWFLLVCPGMVLVRFFRLGDPTFEWVLAIALSLAIDAFVGGILLYTGKWSPTVVFAILLVLTVAGVVAQEIGTVRAQRRQLG